MESMSNHEAPRPSRGRWLLLYAAVAVLLATAGVGYAVHAEWRPAPTIKPYDPLPTW
ncbi:hypothetical protein [Falsiroseomonas sp. CW058]|uniref:hypothetical protein n=1 Tax=Falsiroseomonas sp. CW058 TaxID=3388664 RepID=UPI003D313AA3